jgi:hypothetical protein
MARLMLVFAVASLGALLTHSKGLGEADQDKPAAAPAAKLTKAQFAKVKGGMTLAEVMALLGHRAEINPDPPPFGYAPPEVLVLWRDGKGRRAGVVFVPDKSRVLRVLETERKGGTYKGAAGLTD